MKKITLESKFIISDDRRIGFLYLGLDIVKYYIHLIGKETLMRLHPPLKDGHITIFDTRRDEIKNFTILNSFRDKMIEFSLLPETTRIVKTKRGFIGAYMDVECAFFWNVREIMGLGGAESTPHLTIGNTKNQKTQLFFPKNASFLKQEI